MFETSQDLRWYLLFRRRSELEIKGIFDAYRKMEVEPILIKGWAAAQNYPDSRPRFFGDIDLAVRSADVEKCLARNRTERFTSLNIDLHRELRHLDTTPWNDLFARSKLVNVDGTAIRVLAAEDHLRVLCTHWLTDGGQYKDRLWDIYYAVENRPSDFDWEMFLGSVSETRQNWLKTAIAITRRHLGLDTTGLPFHGDLGDYPGWIDKCLAKEWASDVRLRSLDTCVNNPVLFFKQVRKRLPPNPIQATIESEALFDERSRIPVQIRSISMRFRPSFLRLMRETRRKLWIRKSN